MKLKKMILVMLVMFCLTAFVMPAMAVQDGSDNGEAIDYGKIIDVKKSVNNMQSSPLQKPVSDTMDLVVYAVVIVIAFSLCKGLIKYLCGNSDNQSDGAMSIGRTLAGVAFFVICALLVGGILGWL